MPGWLVFTFSVLAVVIGLAPFGVYMARRELKEARRPSPLPDVWTRPPPAHPPRTYPLTAPLQARLREALVSLEAAGVLQAGEVQPEQAIACAETIDEFTELGLYEVILILSVLSERRPLSNLAFFPDQVEVDESDATFIVRELARLSGQTRQLGAVEITSAGANGIVPARRGEFPLPNAIAQFDLGGQRHRVPFVLYSKNLPGGLMEGLANALTAAHQPRHFAYEHFDSVMAVTYLTGEQLSSLGQVFGSEPSRFEPIQSKHA